MSVLSSGSKKIETPFISLPTIALILFVACGGPDPPPPPCIEAKPDTGETEHSGNYDYRSCNGEGCHGDYIGGWIYNNPECDEIVQGATVTITNSDNTTVEGVTRTDGFFLLVGGAALHVDTVPSEGGQAQVNPIKPPFKPCVSKCPSIECAQTAHTSTDCQSGNCHGREDSHLYVPLAATIPSPCADLPRSGPRVHDALTFDWQTCRTCHDPTYIGGYVYDGLTNNTAVSRATVTLESTTGHTISAVSGPNGLFHFENGIFAPYVACVSKCGESVCSLLESHPTADDCRDCHDETNRIHVP